ncbi:MAG: gamma-glutamyltransferase family protein [Burkholderiales bacterium]|nr:gamma-glutamyltransferase family protein [Burkholderiales bacterium]
MTIAFRPDDRPRIPSADERRPPAIVARHTRPAVRGLRCAISSTHDLATLAGQRVAARGGNAIDAGVAAGIALAVLEPHMCNFGGVAPIMIMRPGMAAPETIDGVGTWPAGLALEDYRQWFGGDMPIGLERSVVPGAPASWLTALARHGRLTLAEVLEPAIELCVDGFAVYPGLASFVNHFAERLRGWPASAAQWLPQGGPLRVGQRMVQPDLGRLLDTLAGAERAAAATGAPREDAIQAAIDVFYRGEVAERIAAFVAGQGWRLTREDLAGWRPTIETAPSVNYRGADVHFCGPWTQGPMIGLALNILEGYDLAAMGGGTVDFHHLFCEAIKLAAADREAFFGDPRYVDVPMRGLLDKAYADERRRLIRLDRACPGLPPPGAPWRHEGRAGPEGYVPAPAGGVAPPDTSYVCAMDAEGNAFSATPSDHAMGSPLVPGLGIVVSHRGAQLWLDPAHPSAMAPGKRPRLTPNPAMLVRGGRAEMAFGSPGEDAQTQAMVQMLCQHLDFGLDLQAAIEAPRVSSQGFPSSFHPHVFRPGAMLAEETLGASALEELSRRGHRVQAIPRFSYGVGALCAVQSGAGGLLGAADPRRDCLALAW